MKFAMSYFFDENDHKITLAKQMGVMNVVTGTPVRGGDERPWEFASLFRKVKRFEDEGLKVSVIEGPSPLDKVKLDLPGKDEEIEIFIELLENMSRLGIETVCYNWMPVIGWFRTNMSLDTRGGAKGTGFDYEQIRNAPMTYAGEVSSQNLWTNLEYFLNAVVPAAEKHGIQLAIHPDDPPVPTLRGISRILINAEAFQRVIDLVPSRYNGITLCGGSFAAMGENVPKTIYRFKDRIFFSHFRDIRGTANNFVEAFHDDGMTDMAECMKAYYDIGYKGCMRPDHVPALSGEENSNPGYSVLGNLFAIGYMKGLKEAVEKYSGNEQKNTEHADQPKKNWTLDI